MNMPKPRITPKLGSIDELLKLSEKTPHESESPSSKGIIQSIPIYKIRFLKTIPSIYMKVSDWPIWLTAFQLTAYLSRLSFEELNQMSPAMSTRCCQDIIV